MGGGVSDEIAVALAFGLPESGGRRSPAPHASRPATPPRLTSLPFVASGSLVKREIVINASALEVRVALLEDGSLTELYLERQQHRGLAGNIYKGKVTRVLPGMQAAFVDIGLEKAGFLHVSDFHDDVQAVGSIAEVIGEDDVETYPVDGDADGEARSRTKTCKSWRSWKTSKSRPRGKTIGKTTDRTIDRTSGRPSDRMCGKARGKPRNKTYSGETYSKAQNKSKEVEM